MTPEARKKALLEAWGPLAAGLDGQQLAVLDRLSLAVDMAKLEQEKAWTAARMHLALCYQESLLAEGNSGA